MDNFKEILLMALALSAVVVALTNSQNKLPDIEEMTLEEYYGLKAQTESNTPHIPMSEPVEDERLSVNACKSNPECRKLSEALVYEARSESIEGQIAVASVILNRVEHPKRWPNTVIGVIEDRHQFSYLQDYKRQRSPTQDDWTKAYIVAFKVMNGIWQRNTKADHYLNPKAVSRMPSWTRQYQRVAVIDNHHFYSSVL